MSEDELKAAQALSQEIDRGFPAIPQSQLDDLIPLEGLDGDDEDKIMALYRTIQGPPKETAFTDEQLERYLAEVRRETLDAAAEEAAKVIAEVRRDALLEVAGIYCKWCNMGIPILPRQPDEDFWHRGDKLCQAREINVMIAAEQGQGEGRKEGKDKL